MIFGEKTLKIILIDTDNLPEGLRFRQDTPTIIVQGLFHPRKTMRQTAKPTKNDTHFRG